MFQSCIPCLVLPIPTHHLRLFVGSLFLIHLQPSNLLAREDWLQAREDFHAASGQLRVLDERIRQDSLLRDNQLQSLDENIRNIKKSLSFRPSCRGPFRVHRCGPVDTALCKVRMQLRLVS